MKSYGRSWRLYGCYALHVTGSVIFTEPVVHMWWCEPPFLRKLCLEAAFSLTLCYDRCRRRHFCGSSVLQVIKTCLFYSVWVTQRRDSLLHRESNLCDLYTENGVYRYYSFMLSK